MTPETIKRRLRKLETQRRPSVPLQGTVIVAANATDAERIRAEMEAAGTYQSDWPLIVVMIPA